MDKISLIHIVLSGKATESETRELEDWISASRENKTEFEDLKLLLENSDAQPEVGGGEDQYYRGLSKIRAAINDRWRKRKRDKTRLSGAVFGMILLSLVVYLLLHRSWVNSGEGNEIRFDGASLTEIVTTLESEYHVEVALDTHLSNCRFTGSFNRANNFDDIMIAIAKALDLEFRVYRGKYTLSGKGCDPGPGTS